jgi:DedD protein
VKPEPAKTEAARVEPASAEHKDKPPKDKPKKEDKPAHAAAPDAARATAILEGKGEASAHDDQKVVLQVAALASQEKAAELQARLRKAGLRSFTQPHGALIRVKVGPYSRDEAEKVKAQLSKLGLSGALSPA